MLKKDKIILEKYNGIHPVCGCGCGEKTVYDAAKCDFGKYKRGHQARVNPNHFGDPKNPKRVEKIKQTRKEKFASGEYDHILKSAEEGRKDPSFGEKISKAKKGISTPKPKGFGIGRTHSEKTKNKMRDSAMNRILNTGKVVRSQLEIDFSLFLEEIDIQYQHSFYIKSAHKIFDYYLPDYNILIEIDGDFWHCNPLRFPNATCKTQQINIKNDQIKNQWAKDNGYKLLRFWEYDIINNPQQIIETLKKELNIL